MRLPLFLAAISCLVFSCGPNDSSKEKNETAPQADSSALAALEIPDTTNLPKFQFKENEFDFGTIKEGEVVKHVFEFTNTGKSDLLISDARGSCGCTIPSYPKTPIAPGANGEIEVQFNSKNKSGENKKFVSITANTYPEVTTIGIKATVNAPLESKGPIEN